MSPGTRYAVLTALLLSVPLSASEARGKGNQKKAAATAPAAGQTPSEQLAPFIEHLDLLLALERPAKPKVAALLDSAPGRIAVLRQSFVEKSTSAEPAERTSLAAAVTTCDTLAAALDERQRTLSQIQASTAVKNNNGIGQRRRDNIGQGTKGGDLSKAVGTIVEARREKAEKREARERAAADDIALTAASVNRWNQRAIDLRVQITATYARIGLAKAQ